MTSANDDFIMVDLVIDAPNPNTLYHDDSRHTP